MLATAFTNAVRADESDRSASGRKRTSGLLWSLMRRFDPKRPLLRPPNLPLGTVMRWLVSRNQPR